MRPSLPFPVKPYIVTQKWGNIPIESDMNSPWFGQPIYRRFGFDKHNGEDVLIGTSKKVSAEFAGTVINIGWQPTGGGLYLVVISDDTYDFDDGKKAQIVMGYLHLQQVFAFTGEKIVLGQPLAIQDNTGFSTGPHTHRLPQRVVSTAEGKYIFLDEGNNANATFDPAPYTNTQFAEDLYQVAFKHNFLIDLSLGMESEEVKALQTALQLDGVFPAQQACTGFFGNITQEAVKGFQVKHNIVSSGTPETTGYGRFGPKTRLEMNKITNK